MKARICSMMGVGLLCCLLISHGIASNVIEHEFGPVHLAGCPVVAGQLISTTLAITPNGNVLYQGSVMRTDFSGSFLKQIRGTNGVQQEWNASDLLAARTKARNLFTSNEKGLLQKFEWGSLDDVQQRIFNRSPLTHVADDLGELRVQFLRGETHEQYAAAGFRSRINGLGAIVHGVPLLVGKPSESWLRNAYQTFREAYRERRAIVYVGAADGMLHAFDQLSGEEIFAYIPAALLENLPLLTVQPNKGVLTIDGGMTNADVMIDGQWRTVLAVGIGRGGRGLFALDVSDPDRFGVNGGLLWEFSHRDDPDIGHLVGSPVITRLRMPQPDGGVRYGQFVMVASGLNNGRDADAASTESRTANALFVLSLEKERGKPWKQGHNYFKLSLPHGESGMANGMTELVAVHAEDDAIERVYAGDLQGNLWRFDFSGGLPEEGKETGLAKLLFVAQDADGQRQPIMQKPEVIFAPGGYLVLFGTGRYLNHGDLQKENYAVQSFYGVPDRGGSRQIDRNVLTSRTVTQEEAEMARIGRHDAENGWYLDFPESAVTGERVVVPATVLGSNLLVSSLMPAAACQPPTMRLYALDALSGVMANSKFPLATTFSGVPGMFVMHSTVVGNEPDAARRHRMVRKIDILQGDGSSMSMDDPSVTSVKGGRLSWRELIDWREPGASGK